MRCRLLAERALAPSRLPEVSPQSANARFPGWLAARRPSTEPSVAEHALGAHAGNGSPEPHRTVSIGSYVTTKMECADVARRGALPAIAGRPAAPPERAGGPSATTPTRRGWPVTRALPVRELGGS